MSAVSKLLWLDSSVGYQKTIATGDTVDAPGDWTFSENVEITGDLTVNGTTTTIKTDDVLISDRFVIQSYDYQTAAARNAGNVYVVDPEATVLDITEASNTLTTLAGAGFILSDDPTGVLAVGDLITVIGMGIPENNGVFQITGLDLVNYEVEIDGTTNPINITVQGIVTNTVTNETHAGTTVQALITVLRADDGTGGTSLGGMSIGFGNAVPLTFNTIATGTGSGTLQTAYDNGNGAIITDATGNLAFSGTQGFTADMDGVITLTSDDTVTLTSNKASATAITVNANGNAAGGLDVNAGTGGIAMDTTDGGAISIDAIGAPSNLTLTATANADDLTLAVVGAFDASLVLNSSGTGADAIDVNATAGGITVDAETSISLDSKTASNFTVTGAADLTLQSTAGSVVVQGGEAAIDAIRVYASNAAGGIDVDAGTGGLTVDTTDGGAISIDAIGAPSNLTLTATANADDLTLAVAGAFDASLVLNSSGTGADAIDVNATAGGITVDAAAGISLDAAGTSNFSTTTGGITLLASAGDTNVTATAGSVVVTGGEAVADAIQITASNAAGGIDVNAGTGGIAMDTTDGGAISIDAIGAPSNITLTATANADDLTLAVAGAFDASLVLNSSGTGADAIDVNATAGGITVDAAAGISLDAAGASNFTVTGAADLTLQSTAGSVVVQGGEAAIDAIRVYASNAAGGIDVDAGTGGIAMDTTDGGALSIDAIGAPSNITLTATTNADDLTIAVAGAFDASLVLNSSGTGTDAIDMNATAGGIDIDASDTITMDSSAGGISLDAFLDSNITITANSAATRILTLSATNAGAGTGAIQITTDGYANIDAVGGVSINSSGATIDIGSNADNFAINLGTNGARTITVGKTGGATGLVFNTGTGGIDINSATGDIAITGKDNSATALVIDAGGNTYLTFDTRDSQEKITLGQFFDTGVSIGVGNSYTNNTGGALAANRLVCTDTGALQIKYADATGGGATNETSRITGMTMASIANAASGRVHSAHGVVVNVSFSDAPAAGDIGKVCFLNTSGQATMTPPSASGDYVVEVGIIQSAVSGGNCRVLFCPRFVTYIA